jgi:hypothetical protein
MAPHLSAWPLFATMGDVLLVLSLSGLLGLPLRRGGAVASVGWGLLVLAGAAACAYNAFRAFGWPTWAFAPASFAGAVALVLVLRRLLPPLAVPMDQRGTLWIVAVLVAVVLPLRLAQVDPSTGLSVMLGWVPLYLRASLSAGYFVGPADLAAGTGILSSYYYFTSTSGLTATLAQITFAADPYPAFLAISIAASLAALAVCVEALAPSRTAAVLFTTLVLASLVLSPFVRTLICRHYGDEFALLAGALILHALAVADNRRQAVFAVAVASLFLVFGRHYGAFYSALLMLAGFIFDRGWRNLGVWIVFGIILAVFSAQEIVWVLHPPSPYYPGSALVELMPRDPMFWIKGTLADWGLYPGSSAPELLVRATWMVALLFVLPRLSASSMPQRLRLLSPVSLLVLPTVLELAVGYRSGHDFNKTTTIAILFFPFYPAFLTAGSNWAANWDQRLAEWTPRPAMRRLALAAIVAGDVAFIPFGRDYYDRFNVDLGIVTALRAAGGEELVAQVSHRPVAYFYSEPGLGLRTYLGGTILGDLDFWDSTVQNAVPAARDLPTLLAELGWPNLYLSSRNTYSYAAYVGDNRWRAYMPALDDIEHQPWVDRVVRYGDARLVIVKPQ